VREHNRDKEPEKMPKAVKVRPHLIFVVFAFALIVLFAVGYRITRAEGKAPPVGSAAPDFTLNSQENRPVTLHEYKGKWVVLYFYPKDFTSGCTVEAHNFQRDQSQYDARNAVILGVSMQDADSHQKFCAKEGLHFKLLADTDGHVSSTYDSVMNLAVAKLSARHTFLIDPNGVVRKVFVDVKPEKHSEEVLAAIDELQKNEAAK
jgi:peroxiredoxin Q/BCP